MGFGLGIDISTFNKRIAECIHRRYDRVLDSGKCDYGIDDTEKGVSYYFHNIKMTRYDIESLAREIDFYVRNAFDICISEHPKVANKPHTKVCGNTQQLFDVDNISMEHNEKMLEKFGGYVIQNHNNGQIIKINRSFLEEKVVLELQKS